MKVTVDLDQALLSRIYAARKHIHKNSGVSFLPEMKLPEFLEVLIEGSIFLYEQAAFGFKPEVSSDDPS